MNILNAALCPKCRGGKTARGGYVREKKASLWKCRECSHEFYVHTLVFAPHTP